MGKGGVIIRLIDIALTVLFGFICIADIEQKTQIKLPAKTTAVSTPQQLKTISVIIFEGPMFHLMDGATLVFSNDDINVVEQEMITMQQNYQARKEDVVFLIQPDPNSPIQLMVNVLDICERNQLSKSINYVEPGV
ncbi:biopolymer transporter ExbD [candidate division KSB1 bacterium]|nr:biopolymer transporter ExbD [candidate division KSB1 bacterium]